MSQTIRIRRGTKAELIGYGALEPGEMGFCTDTEEVFIGSGIENILVGRVMSGALCLWGAASNYIWGSLEGMTWNDFQASAPAA